MGWLVNLRNCLKLSSLTHFWSNRKAIRISPQTFGPPSQLLFVFTQFVTSLESGRDSGENSLQMAEIVLATHFVYNFHVKGTFRQFP